MSETVKNGVGGEDLSDAEKIVSELGDFVKKAKEHKDYEEWREYSVPVKLGIDVEPILKTLKKNAYDFELDTTNSKYDDYLDGLLGVDVDREDFYDPIAGDENDDAYSDARYESRLQKIDAMGEDESINDEYLANGINRFTVEYHVDGGENRGDETLSYTRNMLDRKSMPYSMTTGLAEMLMERIDDNKPGVETLAKMPSFEEHMAEREKSKEIENVYENVAIRSIAENLGVDEEKLRDAVSGGDDSILNEAALKIKEKFNETFIDNDEVESMQNKEYFILDVLSDIHEKWCSNNEAAFFDPEKSDEKYKFLNFSLIGFDDTAAYLEFARPVLEKIGININNENLREQYKDYPLGIDTDGDRLIDAFYGYFPFGFSNEMEEVEGDEVGGAYYFAEALHIKPSVYLSSGASEKISKAIEKDFNLAAEMTMQVGEHRASQEADYGSLWAYHERGADGLYDYWIGSYDPFDTSGLDNDPYFTSQEYINDGWD